MKIVNTQRAITPKAGNQSYGSCVLHIVSRTFNICVKFHENMSSSFKVMERTRKLLTYKGQ